MNPGIFFLLLSSGCEAIWNVCLKQSKGIRDWPVNLVGVSFLIIGIVTFKKALASTSLSIATVIWSGVSLLFTVLLDVYYFKTRLDIPTIFFMIMCVLSIFGLNYYSSKG